MLPVQVPTVVLVGVSVIVRLLLAVESSSSIGNQTSSTPMSFNSTRVMSTPLVLAGLGVPDVGSTVKPIGFGLDGLLGIIVPVGKFEFVRVWRGAPAEGVPSKLN